jgi:hypothetical protein
VQVPIELFDSNEVVDQMLGMCPECALFAPGCNGSKPNDGVTFSAGWMGEFFDSPSEEIEELHVEVIGDICRALMFDYDGDADEKDVFNRDLRACFPEVS